jgi:hypothetical protein
MFDRFKYPNSWALFAPCTLPKLQLAFLHPQHALGPLTTFLQWCASHAQSASEPLSVLIGYLSSFP